MIKYTVDEEGVITLKVFTSYNVVIYIKENMIQCDHIGMLSIEHLSILKKRFVNRYKEYKYTDQFNRIHTGFFLPITDALTLIHEKHGYLTALEIEEALKNLHHELNSTFKDDTTTKDIKLITLQKELRRTKKVLNDIEDKYDLAYLANMYTVDEIDTLVDKLEKERVARWK